MSGIATRFSSFIQGSSTLHEMVGDWLIRVYSSGCFSAFSMTAVSSSSWPGL